MLGTMFLITQKLQCSFMGMTYFLLRVFNMLPKQELHLSHWVGA